MQAPGGILYPPGRDHQRRTSGTMSDTAAAVHCPPNKLPSLYRNTIRESVDTNRQCGQANDTGHAWINASEVRDYRAHTELIVEHKTGREERGLPSLAIPEES